MRRSYTVALVVLLVALNAAAYWYLRERMTNPPGPESAGRPSRVSIVTATADPEGLSGPVLMSGAPDGSVLRATRGDCLHQEPATVWVASGPSPLERVQVSGLVEALAAGRTQRGGWLMVGADATCAVSAWSTQSYVDATWRAVEVPADAWYLDPESAVTVQSPRGPVPMPAGCLAQWVQAVGAEVYVVCADGQAIQAPRTTREFRPVVSEVAAMTVGADGRKAYLVASQTCPAQLRVIDGPDADDGECLAVGKAPLGIAWTGQDLVAQVGFDLLGNASGSWEVRD